MNERGDWQELSIPMMPGFKSRILPVLVVYWILTAIFALLNQPIALVIGSWATVTTIMVWPVGAPFGKAYGSYRTAWFIIGVASMIGIPLFGFAIIASTDSAVKYAALLGLAIDIGVWGILASTKRAFSRPIPMFFRPDLIFGDGRILAGGIVAAGLGLVSMFGPPGITPKGNWYALFSVIVLALIQIIPLRGMWKMRNRLSRLLFDRWDSYLVTVAKESYLILAVVALMFSFHNFFGGIVPFTTNVLAGSNEGLVVMVIAALFVILVRSWYKKYRIGDPFIVESFSQGLVKHGILAIGLVGFLYGLVNVMMGHFPRTINTGDFLYQSFVGAMMLAWGIILLVPVRAWAQGNQIKALHRQMVEVVLPRLSDDLRAKAIRKVITAVSEIPEERRDKIVKDMTTFLGEMDEKDRQKVMKTQLEVLSSLPEGKRLAMMRAMDNVLLHSQ